MPDTHVLFAELEATLTNGQTSQRFSILRKITDLFLAEVDTYSDDHVAVFDELMSRLIDRIESQALVELSGKLAPMPALRSTSSAGCRTTTTSALRARSSNNQAS